MRAITVDFRFSEIAACKFCNVKRYFSFPFIFLLVSWLFFSVLTRFLTNEILFLASKNPSPLERVAFIF